MTDPIGEYARAMEHSEEPIFGLSCYALDESGQVVAVGTPFSWRSVRRAFGVTRRGRMRPSTVGNLISGDLSPHPFSILLQGHPRFMEQGND